MNTIKKLVFYLAIPLAFVAYMLYKNSTNKSFSDYKKDLEELINLE